MPIKKDSLQVAKSVERGPKDVALVWSDEGRIRTYVSDQELADAPPQNVLMAWAVMMPMDDNQLVGTMWDNFERMMDKDIHR